MADLGTVQQAMGWRAFFGDGVAAPTAVILLLANIAQWVAAWRERRASAAELAAANQRALETARSVTELAREFAQTAQVLKPQRRSSGTGEHTIVTKREGSG